VSTIQSTQIWLIIFWTIQNPWINRRSVKNEKCLKLDFVPPWISPDISSLAIYFSWAEYGIWVYFWIGKSVASAAHLLVAVSPDAMHWLAGLGGIVLQLFCPRIKIRGRQPCRPCWSSTVGVRSPQASAALAVSPPSRMGHMQARVAMLVGRRSTASGLRPVWHKQSAWHCAAGPPLDSVRWPLNCFSIFLIYSNPCKVQNFVQS
jgi:hypothetical protein